MDVEPNMVAAMPLSTESPTVNKAVTTNDIGKVALFAAGVLLIAAAAYALASDNASPATLADEPEKRFISIPSGQSGNIDENSAAGTSVMTVSTTGGTPTGCAISSGNSDNDGDGTDTFTISSSCEITVADADDLDYEGTAFDLSWTLQILANDASGAGVGTVDIDMNDVAATITSSSLSVDEDAGDTDAVGSITSSGDSDDGNGFSESGGTGAALFAITAGGDITVTGAGNFNAEATTSYTYEVQITDGTTTDTEVFTITINDVNDNLPDYGDADTANVAENTQTVGTYTATDADITADLTYSIAAGDDGALFSIDPDTGELTFATAPDYDNDPCDALTGAGAEECVVTLEVTDGTNTDTKQITVTDANDQTPTYSAGSTTPTVTEGDTAVDSNVAITDTDTGDANQCNLGGDDSGLFTCTLTDQTHYSLSFTS
ncbi:MAG: cadherin domain-containing protein, partial [Candidatus Thalassarchaeaceae archaeon]